MVEVSHSWVTNRNEGEVAAKAAGFLSANVGAGASSGNGLTAAGGNQTLAVLLGPALVGARALPMTATITWGRDGGGTRVTARFADAYALKFPGIIGIKKYERCFRDLLASLQQILPPGP